ncbi:MAG: hypothetical protein ACI87W_003572 [Halieaceae bacterium]
MIDESQIAHEPEDVAFEDICCVSSANVLASASDAATIPSDFLSLLIPQFYRSIELDLPGPRPKHEHTLLLSIYLSFL